MTTQKKTRQRKNKVKKQVYDLFLSLPEKTFNYKQVSHQLKIHDKPTRGLVKQALNELKQNNKLIQVKKGKYKLPKESKYVSGTVDMTMSGNAYVISPDTEDDVFIAANKLNTALDGDKVKVLLYARKKKKKKLKGEIVEVIERAQTDFVGKLEVYANFAFLIPDKKNMPFDIYIPKEDGTELKEGAKAVARITDWSKDAKNPFGKIIEILGQPGDNDVEMTSIVVDSGFPLSFPEEVRQEAEQLPDSIDEQTIQQRRDLRQLTTFTIDPEDAKDFDDALSIQKLDNGNWEVGIHIADVSHYVKPGTALDKEGYKRATSVYLVDRVIPMLPEKISNEICSLRPEEDKLAFSAVFELNEKSNVQKEWFGRTVIRSDKRFTYDEAQQQIESGKGNYADELRHLQQLSDQLRETRFKEGSIAFETVEMQFEIGLDGVPLGVYLKERKDAHYLIEDFMLLANRRVAAFMAKQQKGDAPFVYRVHDYPDSEKLAEFSKFATRFGYKPKFTKPDQFAHEMNRLMRKIEGTPEQNILEKMAIKTMAKAYYSPVNIGHYGLGFPYYTHFTSPIRRYPDVMVHRFLARQLQNKPPAASNLEDRCEHVSMMERKALEAERTSLDYKQAEYMAQHEGDVFEGIISGMLDWGFFVELIENKCEGAVRLSTLDDDFYEMDEENFALRGRSSGRTFHLGDKVKVRVIKTDLVRKNIDFELVE